MILLLGMLIYISGLKINTNLKVNNEKSFKSHFLSIDSFLLILIED